MSSSRSARLPSPKLRAVVARQTLAKQIYLSLKKAIVDGDLRPGTRLKEAEVAVSLGASRTPVREAFSRLQHEGLARPLKSGGFTVAELSERDLREVLGLLQVLESYAARLAAERITPKQVERLDAVCSRAEKLLDTDSEKLSELNQRFHELIIEASNHARLQGLIGSLRVAMQPYRALFSPTFRVQSVRDHRQAIELLRVRDADRLGQLMARHLETAEDAIAKSIRAQARRFAGRS